MMIDVEVRLAAAERRLADAIEMEKIFWSGGIQDDYENIRGWLVACHREVDRLRGLLQEEPDDNRL